MRDWSAWNAVAEKCTVHNVLAAMPSSGDRCVLDRQTDRSGQSLEMKLGRQAGKQTETDTDRNSRQKQHRNSLTLYPGTLWGVEKRAWCLLFAHACGTSRVFEGAWGNDWLYHMWSTLQCEQLATYQGWVCKFVCVSRHDAQIFSVNVDAAIFKLGE